VLTSRVGLEAVLALGRPASIMPRMMCKPSLMLLAGSYVGNATPDILLRSAGRLLSSWADQNAPAMQYIALPQCGTHLGAALADLALMSQHVHHPSHPLLLVGAPGTQSAQPGPEHAPCGAAWLGAPAGQGCGCRCV
jgi:hypothetical protein